MSKTQASEAHYMISAVAQKYSIHPQTLRLYEREGLLKPSRTDGNTRLYGEEDLKQLETERRPAAITSHQCAGRSQSAPCALASDGESTGVDPQLARVLGRPAQGPVAILQACGKGVLGRQPVIGRDHHGLELPGYALAPWIHHILAAHDEAPSVDFEDGGSGRGRLAARAVNANFNVGLTRRTRDGLIADENIGARGRALGKRVPEVASLQHLFRR